MRVHSSGPVYSNTEQTDWTITIQRTFKKERCNFLSKLNRRQNAISLCSKSGSSEEWLPGSTWTYMAQSVSSQSTQQFVGHPRAYIQIGFRPDVPDSSRSSPSAAALNCSVVKWKNNWIAMPNWTEHWQCSFLANSPRLTVQSDFDGILSVQIDRLKPNRSDGSQTDRHWSNRDRANQINRYSSTAMIISKVDIRINRGNQNNCG